MKVECKCGEKDVGNYKKLIKKGWEIFFLYDGNKVVTCNNCKPNLKDKIKTKVYKDYHPQMYHDIGATINKLKLLKGLKSKEEIINESIERKRKQKKHYHYKRNINKKKDIGEIYDKLVEYAKDKELRIKIIIKKQ